MNAGPLIFLASFFALATSWFGFVLMPQLQIGRQQPVELADTGQAYPPMRPGEARQGEQVYRANGCFYCHSQQLRPEGFGADAEPERGWRGRPGVVQSVAEDYLYDRPAMLGTQRIGPDLTNIGLRQTNEMELLKHLYNPRASMPTSVMPPYRYLFDKHELKRWEKPSPDALNVPGVAAGYEILPKPEAKELVAYLLSLHSQGILFETPPPPASPTNAVAGNAATNAPAAKPATNAPAK
jgi:cytochrome c oxidase cbb3-type subunit 2